VGRTNIIGGFEHAVLIAVLQLGESAAYGVSIVERIGEYVGRRVSTGAVYSTLERLEAKGHLSSYLWEPEHVAGGRAKKLYQLEPKGWEALLTSKQALDHMWEGVNVQHVSQRLGTPSLKLKESERKALGEKRTSRDRLRSPKRM
jgi:DNA-binding PadR family transcriptional regulator